jgi:hypothetical protein
MKKHLRHALIYKNLKKHLHVELGTNTFAVITQNRCSKPRFVHAQVTPIAGMALFHVHGDRCLLHEAKVVSRGVKYMLRSDVIFA